MTNYSINYSFLIYFLRWIERHPDLFSSSFMHFSLFSFLCLFSVIFSFSLSPYLCIALKTLHCFSIYYQHYIDRFSLSFCHTLSLTHTLSISHTHSLHISHSLSIYLSLSPSHTHTHSNLTRNKNICNLFLSGVSKHHIDSLHDRILI